MDNPHLKSKGNLYKILCEFVATFCVNDRSAPCWFVDFSKKLISPVLLGLTSPLKRENSFQQRLELTGNLLLMCQLSLVYFCHHQGFVYTRANSNLFVAQLIVREINSNRHHVFVPLCGTFNTIKFIWEVETRVSENFFQFNCQ